MYMLNKSGTIEMLLKLILNDGQHVLPFPLVRSLLTVENGFLRNQLKGIVPYITWSAWLALC